MAINYVKFQRGTPTAYANLPIKDNDTLYFICEKDKTTGVLYLGTKKIGGVTSLDDLISLEEGQTLNNGDILVYDSETQGWVAANPSDLSLGNQAKVYQIELQDGETHEKAIERSVEPGEENTGDIVIISEDIDGTHKQYTAYVYNGEAWAAMDGNYKAENVYFTDDLITTTEIGNISLTNGQATIAAAGKNLKEVWNNVFVKESQPSITLPSVALTATKNKAYEVGTTVAPTYSIVFNAGKYEFGPATGVTATAYSASFNGESLDVASGTFSEITVEDSSNLVIEAYASYSEGAIPLTNLGNNYTSGQIVANNTNKVKSAAVTGYRNTFYGTLEDKDIELTSEVIRELTASNKALKNGDKFTITIPIGAKRVVIAYPSTLQEVSSILDGNAFNADIKSSFKSGTVNVEGANGYSAITYKLYYLDYANANDVENTYTVTI